MIKYKSGDVVFAAFFQTDGKRKQRPALVVLDTGDDDIILAPITTTERKSKGDYKIKNWQESGLLLDSWVRLAKITCLSIARTVLAIGKVNSQIFSSLPVRLGRGRIR